MFKNVIVGVDGRSGGRDAAALARRLLGPQGRLTMVHVHLETTAVIVHEFDSSAREEAQKLLEGEREAAGGEAELAHSGGTSVAAGLHRYAEEHSADLLVVGACHRGVVGRVLAGDDARDSLQGAPCAVAISPRGYAEASTPIEIIGVGYDGSAKSHAALARAGELAGGGDAEIHALILVTAVRFDGSKLAPMNSVMETDPRLNDMRRQLNELDRVTARPAYGLPVEELGTFGEEVDLLLLGSSSSSSPSRSRVVTRSPARLPSRICPSRPRSSATRESVGATVPQPSASSSKVRGVEVASCSSTGVIPICHGPKPSVPSAILALAKQATSPFRVHLNHRLYPRFEELVFRNGLDARGLTPFLVDSA